MGGGDTEPCKAGSMEHTKKPNSSVGILFVLEGGVGVEDGKYASKFNNRNVLPWIWNKLVVQTSPILFPY